MWNNNADDRITYRYGEAYLHFGQIEHARPYERRRAALPGLYAAGPVLADGAYGEHVHRTQWHAQIDYFNVLTVTEELPGEHTVKP